jgi:hypothetical protein
LQAFKQEAVTITKQYVIWRGAERTKKLDLVSEPVLHWTNPTVGATYGSTFVWTANGRPEAMASIHRWRTKAGVLREQHELVSLSLDSLHAVRDGRAAWYPAQAGIELKTIPGAVAPADSPVLRLSQMRTLAREFRCLFGPEPNRTEMRLMPQPVYRYESSDPRLLDGAVFAFVRATDPDVLLLLEARQMNGAYEWQYALARQAASELTVFHKGQEVHKFQKCWDRVFRERGDAYTALEEDVPVGSK